MNLRRVALVPCVAIGCGMLGADSLDEPQTANAIAPWTELGFVEFCLGELRLTPKSVLPAGLCVASSAAKPLACVDDTECHSREECLCGRCTAVTCDTDRDCAVGHVCDLADAYPRCAPSCSDSRSQPCAQGETCQNGVCRGGCAGDGDCQSGEVCLGSERHCIAPRCLSDDTCLSTETCVLQREPRPLTGPSAISDGTDIVLYVASEGGILRAVGTDGRSFRVDPPDPIGEGSAPTVLRIRTGFVIFVEHENEILRATSDDGITFGESHPVLSGSAPAVFATDVETTLLFARENAIWRARSSDGLVFVEDAEAMLTARDVEDPIYWHDVESLGDPAAWGVDSERGPVVQMLFAAFGVESEQTRNLGVKEPARPNFSIGYAASLGERVSVYPFNPVFDRMFAFLTHLEETGPTVVFHRGRYVLYFEAGAQGEPRSSGIGVAVNPADLPSGL